MHNSNDIFEILIFKLFKLMCYVYSDTFALDSSTDQISKLKKILLEFLKKHTMLGKFFFLKSRKGIHFPNILVTIWLGPA